MSEPVANAGKRPPGISRINKGQKGVKNRDCHTPMVAGAVALLYAARPNITAEQMKRLIVNKAEPGPITRDPDGFPGGVLDVSSF